MWIVEGSKQNSCILTTHVMIKSYTAINDSWQNTTLHYKQIELGVVHPLTSITYIKSSRYILSTYLL